MDFFATAAKGTEGVLRDELRELRVPRVRADRGGVHFQGEPRDAWRVCLYSRIAMRVLRQVAAFEARTPTELYDGVRSVAWQPFLSARHTLAVSANCKSSALTHTQFIAQKTKDAIVDQLRDDTGARPSVDARDPDVRVQVHLVRDLATVYLDLAGDPLHRRGYRLDHTEAPLKETLAAAILRLAGWDRRMALTDPMCGSGTFAIEAAWWATDRAPALSRKRFGFERWADHDASAREHMVALRNDALERARVGRALVPRIVASDHDETAVAATRGNARAAHVDIEIGRRAVSELQPVDARGLVVTNPPYGERLRGGDPLYREMATAFARMRGHRIVILAGAPEIIRAIRPPPREHTLFNGDIECRLLTYDVD